MNADERQRSVDRRRLIAAIVAGSLLVLGTLAIFAKHNPLASHYEIRGVFATANQLREGSAVRVSGLDVGKVAKIEAGAGHTAVVTLRISDREVPIRTDARLAIEPRLALEGNFYVKVEPGSPGARELRDGETIGRARTSVPVQLDQALNTFDAPTRRGLASTFAELAGGLGDGGAAGLRDAASALDGALGSITTVSKAAQGRERGELRRAFGATGELASQLAADPDALAGLMSSYSRVSGALAARDRSLAASIGGFDRTFKTVPSTLPPIDAALPELTRFASDLRPVLRRAPATLRATSGLLDQIDATVRPAELPRLLRALKPVTSTLPTLQRRLGALGPKLTPIADCLNHQVLPLLEKKLEDGPNTTGDEIWKEILHAGASIAGTSPNADGNGTQIRLSVVEGDQNVRGEIPGYGAIETKLPRFGGMQPEWLGYGVHTPSRPDQRCAEQADPALQSRWSPGPKDWLTPVDKPKEQRSPTAGQLRALDRLGLLDRLPGKGRR